MDKILIITIAVCVIVLIINLILARFGRETTTSVLITVIAIVFLLLLLWISRRRYNWVGIPYVIILLVAITFSQPPEEAFVGSNILMLSLPMVAATYLISPYSAFVLLPIIIGDLFLLSFMAGEGFWGVYPSPNTIGVLIITAVVSWAGAVSVQAALGKSEKANEELAESKKKLKKHVGMLESMQKDLKEKVRVLEVFQEAAVERELRIAELKKKEKRVGGED